VSGPLFSLPPSNPIESRGCGARSNESAFLRGAGRTGRYSRRLLNARFSNERKLLWDERAGTLEAQITQPIQDHIEMGFRGADGDPDLKFAVEEVVGDAFEVLAFFAEEGEGIEGFFGEAGGFLF
jgi:cytochrome c peroxidase